jgi:hypothetical protein
MENSILRPEPVALPSFVKGIKHRLTGPLAFTMIKVARPPYLPDFIE